MATTQELDIELLQNRDELSAAGVPESYLRLISRAAFAFWGTYADQFPEVTSGDSQMCDEPGNAIALWLCQGTAVPIDAGRLCFAEQPMSEMFVDRVRMVQVLATCIKSARASVSSELPDLAPPTVQVMDYLYNVMDHVLYWNFPRPPHAEDHDQLGDGENSAATGSDSIQ